jgi:GNAT superfamily N-acetyltransferase
MELWRLRVEADDVPGQLASIAESLAGVDANIVSIDVHAAGGSRVADEVVITTADPVDPTLLARVLAARGAHLVDARTADAHELVDPATQALDAVAGVVAAGAGPAALGAAMAQVVRCERSYLRPVGVGLALGELEARAVAEDRPAMGRALLKSLPSGGAGAWVLAMPTALGGRPHVAVAARRTPRFSYTETARLRALLGLAEAAQGSGADRAGGAATTVHLRDGGEVVLRPLGPTDGDAVLRLHGRCGRSTLQRRYFSSMRHLPPALLQLLVDVDGVDRTAVAAAAGSELLGIAHLSGLAGGTPEVAVLVEDGHQRRGIGAALLLACVREASGRARSALTAVCLPDNDAFPALVGACGFRASSRLEDGVRVLTFALADRVS